MKIVEYEDKYLESLKELIETVKIKEMKWPKPAEDLDDVKGNYQINNGNFWVAVDKERVIGSIALQDMGEGRGYLKRMYLLKEYRGTGTADALFDRLLDQARSKGFSVIYLATNDEAVVAIKFYEKHGFVKVDTLPMDFDRWGDCLFYRLEINER